MTELNQVFDGDLAEQVFLIGSIIFFFLVRLWNSPHPATEARARRTVFHGKTAVTALAGLRALEGRCISTVED